MQISFPMLNVLSTSAVDGRIIARNIYRMFTEVLDFIQQYL